MNNFVRLTSFLLILVIDQALSNSASLKIESSILKSILAEYDPTSRPAGINETSPVIVEINTYVRHIGDIDDKNMVYDTQLTLRQSWQDNRLKYDVKNLKYVTLTNQEKIWLPDLFFSNEDSGHFHDIIKPNILIRIFPNGQVLYSTRISLRLFCGLNLKNYPMDNQVCNIIIASYGYTTDDVYFLWKRTDAVQMTKRLNLRKFKLNALNQGYCTSKTNTGEYSCLKLELYFSRNFFHFLESAYMPTTALVLLSWVAMWFNPKYSSIRFGIWFAAFISIFMVATSVSFQTPETPYRKALDVWIGTCVTFIFLVLIELCAVNNAIVKADACIRRNQLTNIDPMSESNSVKLEDLRMRNKLHRYLSTPLRWYKSCTSTAHRIDFLSRIIFPIMFVSFFLFYWMVFYIKPNLCNGEDCMIFTN